MKKLRKVLAVVTALALAVSMLGMVTVADEVTVVARADAVTYNGHTYQILYADGLSWGEMEAFCESVGGYLACITTAEEDAFLYSYVSENGCADSTLFGFSDAEEEGNWVWVSGEETDYTNWGSSEPSDSSGYENYAHYYTNYPDGEWNDTALESQTNNFLIEWNYIDDGETYIIPEFEVVLTYNLTINVASESDCYDFYLNGTTYGGYSNLNTTIGGKATVTFGVMPEIDCTTYSVKVADVNGNELDVTYDGPQIITTYNITNIRFDENWNLLYDIEEVETTTYMYTFSMPESDAAITLEYGEEVHTWDEGEVVTEATCTEEGEMLYTCTVCGTTQTGVIDALGHTTETQNAKEATCTEEGYTGDEICTVCGEIITTGEVIPATGHTEGEAVKENEVAATCTEAGSYESVVYCSVCGEELSRETVAVEATGHTEGEAVKENEVATTCTEAGSYESVVYCSVCGEELSRETVAVEATGHTEAEAVKENEIAATATTAGSYGSVVYCTVCGEELSRDTVTVPATGVMVDLSTILADYTAVNNAIAKANALNASDYTNFYEVTNAINAVNWSYSVLQQSGVNTMATKIENAIANLIPANTTSEIVNINEPIEDTNTKTEDEGETVSEPEISTETNPTTGVALSLVPLAIAALAVVSSKRK